MQNIFKLTEIQFTKLNSLRGYLGWVFLLLLNLIIIISLRNNFINPEISGWAPQLLLNVYLLTSFIYLQMRIKPVERYDFMQLIWKMFAFGLVVVLFSLFFEAVHYLFADLPLVQQNSFWFNLFYIISVIAISTYLVSVFVAWKRLVFYEKSRILTITWRVFEYGLITSMVLSLFNIEFNSFFYNAFLIGLTFMGILLSINLKWVAYLDFTQKWQAFLVILGLLVCFCYFAFFIFEYAADSSLLLNVIDNVFILALLAFAVFYSVLSGLVIFFNLPTSSVYEKKVQEVAGFQQLNRIVQDSEGEEKLWVALLENAMHAIDAQQGWVEVNYLVDDRKEEDVRIFGELSQEELNEVIGAIKNKRLKNVFSKNFQNRKERHFFVGGVKHPFYRSILVVPLEIQEKHAGLLVLLKDVDRGFNRDAIDIAKAYADQTCISIENMQLFEEALVAERYKEEVAIAQRVHSSLLPEELESNEAFELAVFSDSADDVGGDYYDVFKISEHKYALIIADVAGHGTSAAFTMSQLKGVFHSLVQFDFSCTEFLEKANSALSRCLPKQTFITVTYLTIDTDKKVVNFARAGHCPTIYFDAEKQELLSFKDKTLGLGILRNDEFGNFIENNFVNFRSGDVMVLYTDGVIECKDENGEEYGCEKLCEIVRKNASLDVVELQTEIINDISKHCKMLEVQDDYTTLVIKFS